MLYYDKNGQIINPSPHFVKWYRQHGKYPDHRIKHTVQAGEYVIGDWSWNARHPNNDEYVDMAMREYLRRVVVDAGGTVKG